MSKILSIIVSIILLTPLIASSQIVLVDEKIPLKPTEYYISGITDDRTEKGPVAKLIFTTQDNKTTSKSIDLQNGVATSVTRYIGRSLPKNESLRPVSISIKELKVTESNRGVGSINGQI